MIRTVDVPVPRPAGARNGAIVPNAAPRRAAAPPRTVAAGTETPDSAAGPGADFRVHRDAVSATHDAIDFARALVADGGVQTAGLTMLRGEVQAVARELRAARQEFAALRVDVDRLRADLLRTSQFCRGVLVDRLAAKFQQVDAALTRLEGRA